MLFFLTSLKNSRRALVKNVRSNDRIKSGDQTSKVTLANFILYYHTFKKKNIKKQGSFCMRPQQN